MLPVCEAQGDCVEHGHARVFRLPSAALRRQSPNKFRKNASQSGSNLVPSLATHIVNCLSHVILFGRKIGTECAEATRIITSARDLMWELVLRSPNVLSSPRWLMERTTSTARRGACLPSQPLPHRRPGKCVDPNPAAFCDLQRLHNRICDVGDQSLEPRVRKS